MDEREQRRKIKHRLNVLRHAEEVTGNVALTCRYFGITRTTFYKWRNRYDEFGADGLRDRSSAPHHSPTATPADVVGKIIHLRSHYHFGPHKISMYLARYHEVKISPSGVWRILKKLGMNRLPASQRYKPHNKRWHRYEKPQPGHRLQIDVKFIEPLAGSTKKHYQFTAIDDCTRLRVLRIYDRCNQATAIRFVNYVLEKLPFEVHSILTDNGAEFQSQFHWHVVDQGIEHAYIKPNTPRLNGKVERSHRIDQEEFYRLFEGDVIDDADLFNIKLQEWEDYYNFDRPHGALDGQTPYGDSDSGPTRPCNPPPSVAHLHARTKRGPEVVELPTKKPDTPAT